MRSVAVKRVPMRTSSRSESIKEFSPERLQAPFLMRFGAVLIDYILFMLLPVMGLLSDRLFSGGFDLVTDETLWLLSTIFLILNVIVLPMFSTRSIGKIVAGLRIVNTDGTIPKPTKILFRQTIGYLLTILTLGLGFLFCMFNPCGRALHDYLADTVVVSGRRRFV